VVDASGGAVQRAGGGGSSALHVIGAIEQHVRLAGDAAVQAVA